MPFPYRFFHHSAALSSLRYISGTKLDERIIRADLDPGYLENRQYGRGKSGGQVRDEYRDDFDAGRGGWGHLKTRQEMEGERQREQDELYREQERGGGYAQPTGHGGDEVSAHPTDTHAWDAPPGDSADGQLCAEPALPRRARRLSGRPGTVDWPSRRQCAVWQSGLGGTCCFHACTDISSLVVSLEHALRPPSLSRAGCCGGWRAIAGWSSGAGCRPRRRRAVSIQALG